MEDFEQEEFIDSNHLNSENFPSYFKEDDQDNSDDNIKDDSCLTENNSSKEANEIKLNDKLNSIEIIDHNFQFEDDSIPKKEEVDFGFDEFSIIPKT